MIDQLCRSAVSGGDDREKAKGHRFDEYSSSELSNARQYRKITSAKFEVNVDVIEPSVKLDIPFDLELSCKRL
jgi:hypothetical protein